MIILDPDRDGCHVWSINSSFKEDFVSYIKGTPKEVITKILPSITTYVGGRNQYGNRCSTLVLTDMVYIDHSPIVYEYTDIFDDLGFYLNVIPTKSKSKMFWVENKKDISPSDRL